MSYLNVAEAARKIEAANYVRSLRERAGLTQEEMRLALGWGSKHMLSHIENGRVRMPLNHTPKLAEAAGLQPRDVAKKFLSLYDPEFYDLLFDERPEDA